MGLLGSVLGTDQQKRAIEQAGNIARTQTALARGTYENYLAQALSSVRPYTQAGEAVLPQLQQVAGQQIAPTSTGFTMADFFNEPGYQFQLGQGIQGINQAAAARSNFFTPETMQALGSFQQGLAGTSYGDAFTRYLQQTGQLYGQQMGSQQQLYNQLANIYGIGAGAAGQAAGLQVGTGQAIAGGQMQLGSDLSNLALARGRINPFAQALQLGAAAAGAFMNPAAGMTSSMSIPGGVAPGGSVNLPPMKV